MRIVYAAITALMGMTAPAVAAEPVIPVQAQTASDREADELVQRAVGLIGAKAAGWALPLLDSAIAIEEKAHAKETRQIFSAGSPQETLRYAAMGATLNKEVVVFGPTRALANFLKGFALIEDGSAASADQAKAYLERAVQLSPSNAQFLAELGEWHKSRQDWTTAYGLFERAYKFAGVASGDENRTFEQGRALRGMAFVLARQGELEEAEKLYRSCLELDPKDYTATERLDFIGKQRARANRQRVKVTP